MLSYCLFNVTVHCKAKLSEATVEGARASKRRLWGKYKEFVCTVDAEVGARHEFKKKLAQGRADKQERSYEGLQLQAKIEVKGKFLKFQQRKREELVRKIGASSKKRSVEDTK